MTCMHRRGAFPLLIECCGSAAHLFGLRRRAEVCSRSEIGFAEVHPTEVQDDHDDVQDDTGLRL